MPQVIAGHLPRNATEFGANGGQVIGGEAAQFGFQVVGAGGSRGVAGHRCADAGAGRGDAESVRGDATQFDHMVRGAPVADRVVAARVVADGAAEAGAALARRIGAKVSLRSVASNTASRSCVSTTPASAVAVRAASSTASTQCRCRDMSTIRPPPMELPDIDVPPPRTVSGIPRRWHTRAAAATSSSDLGNTTAAGVTR